MKHILLLSITLIALSIQAQNYNYLGTYTSNGTPEYLLDPSDNVSQETLDMIANALPEGYPVPDYNPHYISSGYETDIHLNDNAEVFVTFVGEGAGYKNVLGFYTYPSGQAPEDAPSKEDITIIFPNVSALYSGGGLLTGNKVKIGNFKAGTSIGWVLLANGWKNGAVTDGHWQVYSNTNYNPEADSNLRQHNVLLADPENERIILGFEDIRRDYASCDQDFNDAIFYVTANPYDAITTENITDVSTATDVTSGNNGGLESNGTLAEKIAKRNFSRGVKQNFTNTKSAQISMAAHQSLKSSSTSKLQTYIPSTGMFGTETAYVSSPEDLVEITNATEVFSVDYYKNDKRIAVTLATYTPNAVYDHSKAICDRLNNSSLQDVRLVQVRGHQIIHSKLLRATGQVENTLSFSIKENGNNYELFSYWNIDQYPEGSYYNFQIWGGNNAQVFAIANQIIDQFKSEKNVISDVNVEKIPSVFVKSGFYQNGKIHLELINNDASKSVNFNANYKETEHSSNQNMSKAVALSGNRYETVIVETGSLFDAGISLKSDATEQMDALYLADGPWGVDYLKSSAEVSFYDISRSTTEAAEDRHFVERNLYTSGKIKNTFNVFRQVLPGDQTLNVTDFNTIEFTSQSTHPIELVLMHESINNWENRFRYILPANTNAETYSINFNDFVDNNGNSANIEDVKRIVFSLNGNGETFEDFELSIDDVNFTTKSAISTNIIEEEADDTSNNTVFPNPFTDQTTIKISFNMSAPIISVYNVAGKLVDQQKLSVVSASNRILYTNSTLQNGLYVYVIKEEGSESERGRFMVSK
ncbi:DUF4114 domain-containing protein [Saccharicrinis aurantiacus]|uniref:DUF4114 domain-containing protein n=1 Tax=Saccharicrinis aurantiacus TaxID=1849719 RepID=UPI00094F6E86|nr:DUF4114 domain-containing protein [Saccharicrinis aurantiacus]